MKYKAQCLLWVLVGGVWLMTGCTKPPGQPNLSTLAITPTSTHEPLPQLGRERQPAQHLATTPTYEAPLPKPRFCTPIPDQDEQLATLGREWPRLTWLPERVKLCEIDRRWEDLGERIVLSFEGEGRFYNSVAVSITHYVPPRQRGETEPELLKVNKLEIRKSFSYGHTILTWPLNGLWIQLMYLGDALDEEEAIRIVEGIIPPP